MLNHVGLFEGSGIPSWCAQQAGFRTVAWCENDPWCANWLREYLPDAEAILDIKTADWPAIAARLGRVDLLTGGFPCQPVSCAGRRKGEADERWLWPEMRRAIVGLNPAWILAENVPGLRTKGSDTVLADLEAEGYTATASVVGARSCGAMHRRERVWIVAQLVHAQGQRCGQRRQPAGRGERRSECPSETAAHGIGPRLAGRAEQSAREKCAAAERSGNYVVYTTSQQREGLPGQTSRQWPTKNMLNNFRHVMPPGPRQHNWEAPRLVESSMGGATYGVAGRVYTKARKELLRTLGNGWHPTVPAAICRWIAGQIKADVCRREHQ